jgi:hydroxymethylpyrimidine pyrophosphatase-like HAD family hydrolase
VHLGIVVSDLDGTLLDSQHQLSAANRSALIELGQRGVVRVVATGRTLFSALRVVREDFPIDFLVCSSGAGICRWPSRELIQAQHMSAEAALRLARLLGARGLDFMLHHAIPDNHRCWFHRTARSNDDFERRRQLYASYMLPFGSLEEITGPMCQAVVIEPPPGLGCYLALRRELSEYSVLRATSPLDGASTWIEVFPAGVCKSAAAGWLQQAQAPGTRSLAVGNDYNDVDLLDWADLGCVVGNAPAELRARYRRVASHDASGFSEAVRLALEQG